MTIYNRIKPFASLMMNLKVLMISQFLLVLVVKNSSPQCVPCSLLPGCPELNCLGGKVLGLCGCCYVCAKQLNEQCGGLYGLVGTCDQGLHCVLPPQDVNETVTIIHHVGVCQVTAETTSRPDEATQPAKSTARYKAATPQGGVLRADTTLRHNTSKAQVSSGLTDMNTSPDPKLQNGVSAFLQTKGVDVLCLITCLCVSFRWK